MFGATCQAIVRVDGLHQRFWFLMNSTFPFHEGDSGVPVPSPGPRPSPKGSAPVLREPGTRAVLVPF